MSKVFCTGMSLVLLANLLVARFWPDNSITGDDLVVYIYSVGATLGFMLTVIVWEIFDWLDDVRKELRKPKLDNVVDP
jgi:hypothetical protein